MDKKNRGVFIGRFQPFHLGHVHCVQQILKQVPELILAIGSAQFSHTLQNPFTAGERVTMIRAAMDENKIDASKYYLIPIRDLRIHDLWVSHLVSQTPHFETVFSNEPVTSRLFKEAGYRVEPIPFYDREIYSATEIRAKIINRESWEKLVPSTIAKYIKEISGDERLRELMLTDKPIHHRQNQPHNQSG
ncbi:MAG TPA: nicotinamide-nucleotide adenylyltransferase [Candidatus Saccharimonadales bacterium]|nr:nicotinamide-nucleotide adenylyltransferase [Candidatus Saccharimonadales bacterium]